jgi:hypothetical protein
MRWRSSSNKRSRSNASSRPCNSVTSRVTVANPRGWLASSYRAVMTILAQKRDPSLRTRQPSSSTRPSAARSTALEFSATCPNSHW